MASIRQRLEALERAQEAARAVAASRPRLSTQHEAAIIAGIFEQHAYVVKKPADELTEGDRHVLTVAPRLAAIFDDIEQRIASEDPAHAH